MTSTVPLQSLRHFRRARALALSGEPLLAVEAYRRALAVHPDFAEALMNLGILYRQLGDGYAEEAFSCLSRAVQIRPESPRANYNLGVLLSTREDGTDAAIRAFEAVLDRLPHHRNALYALAVQWTRKGDQPRAEHYYRLYRRALEEARARPSGTMPVVRLRFRAR